MDQAKPENLGELDRRYRTTVVIVFGQIFVIFLLIVVALAFNPHVPVQFEDRDISIAWSVVLFSAIASFLARRVLFNWERLKNIWILKELRGLLTTLQINALILSTLGFLVAALGFAIAIVTGSGFDMVRAGLVSLVVLLVNFPRKSVWQRAVSHLENSQKR